MSWSLGFLQNHFPGNVPKWQVIFPTSEKPPWSGINWPTCLCLYSQHNVVSLDHVLRPGFSSLNPISSHTCHMHQLPTSITISLWFSRAVWAALKRQGHFSSVLVQCFHCKELSFEFITTLLFCKFPAGWEPPHARFISCLSRSWVLFSFEGANPKYWSWVTGEDIDQGSQTLEKMASQMPGSSVISFSSWQSWDLRT